MTIGMRIKELRIENGISQLQLAELCNVKQSCVSKWERDATVPDAIMLISICKALKVSADYLLGLTKY